MTQAEINRAVARATGDGFRFDGSRLYGKALAEFARTGQFRDRESPPVRERILGNLGQYAPARRLDPERRDRLQRALWELQREGMDVAVFFPPHSQDAAQQITKNPSVEPWIEEFYEQLPGVLRAAGTPVVSWLVARAPFDDRGFFDGFHPGEVVLASMLEELINLLPAKHPLREVDVVRLQKRIAASSHPLRLSDIP